MTGETSAERIARNDATFRAANERVSDAAREFEMSDRVPFFCECADPTCLEVVQLSLEQYEEVRRNSRHFINVPGHQAAAQGLAKVVAEHGSYIVVEKVEVAGQIAEEMDERVE